MVLEVLDEKLHRSSPSHDPLRQQHNSSIFNKADRLYTADSYVVLLSGNHAPISHTLSAGQHREDRAAIATVENVRVQTKVLSALAVGVDKASIDEKQKGQLAGIVADSIQLGEAMASAALEERMKLELGTETVKKMGKSETIDFLNEEEKSRVKKINKEKEELLKLKQENFFDEEEGAAPTPSRVGGADQEGEAETEADSTTSESSSAGVRARIASPALILLYQWGIRILSLLYLPPPLARCAHQCVGRKANGGGFDGEWYSTTESGGWQVE
jgi:hypothetical protein